MFVLYLVREIPACETLDLVFVLDSSGSIRDANPDDDSFDNYALMLSFVINIVNQLDTTTTRIGVVYFSNNAVSEFFLNTFTNRTEIISAIRNLPYLGGDTHTAAGLDEMRINQFSAINGDRIDAANVAVVITDGASTINPNNTIPAAIAARAAGIRIIAVGITENVDEIEVSGISSEPQLLNSNYFLTTNFQVLEPVLDTLVVTACAPTGKHSHFRLVITGMRSTLYQYFRCRNSA